MKKLSLAVIVMSSLVLQSCATLFGGAKYNAHYEVENRPNAKIYVNDHKVSDTGEATTLEARNRSVYVEVVDGDCKVKKEYMNELRVGWLISDIVITGVVPLVVDFATGSMYRPVEGRGVQKLGTDDFKYVINIDDECPLEETAKQ
ncbi:MULTISPECIES: hypothetical protein [unclassified Carboxylicivirga]|uniref:hypothetical protein n=1 Tax=Carboxylicivirga TaxID=1628153 RepID=UPI003D33316B